MAISSNSLFHVTKSYDNLVGILKEGFQVNYCNETFSYNWIDENDRGGESKVNAQSIYVPMVSFSDIPLSEIKVHFEKYEARCAIGLSKDWGIRKGLNPVLYTQAESRLTRNLIHFMQHNFDRMPLEFGAVESETYRMFRYILNHTKNYKGVIRKGRLEPNNLAYNEKEWRYIPTDEELLQIGIDRDLNELQGQAAEFEQSHVQMREMVRQIKLGFVPEDVRYIIVDDKRHVRKLVELLRNKFGDKAGRLIATVFTLEQVFEDF